MKYQNVKMFRITSIFLTILFLGLLSASITHAETYSFVIKWGSQGTGNGQFGIPLGIAVDSSGNVYVADTGNNRVQEFNSKGIFIKQWGSSGSSNGKFSNPKDVAVDYSSNIYVADRGNHRVQKINSNAVYITHWNASNIGDGKTFSPNSVALDSSGNIYVADDKDRIVKFGSNGKYITQWGSEGSGDGQFNDPIGVAVDSSGNVYVLDQKNDRIQKFDSNGKFITKWGSGGGGDGQFDNPLGVAVDSSGNIYVADSGNGRIQKFGSNGKYITQWGSEGSGDGQFNDPGDIAVDSSGNVYATDTNNDRVQKFAPTKSVLPVANFTSNVTKGYVPLSVQFTDISKNSTSRNWNFGDGTNSTLQNPVHIYSKTGNFTVNLTAINANGTNSKTAIITVLAKPALPVANFTSNVTSGNVPLTVAFTDKSTGTPTSWNWTFGDGTYSTSKSPIHKYSKAGNYTVKLIVKNTAGSNTTTKTNYIKVTVITKPVASFTSNVTSGTVPLTVLFTDKSTNTPIAWKWSFGDGTNSTVKNPTHKYSTVGNYTVALTVSNSAGSNTTTKTSYIKVIKK